MSSLPIYHINAFASTAFGGNPAAVVPLDSWLDDNILQKIASQNNLSETSFFVKNTDGYDIRWMTPEVEVDLCGHATLATAYYLFEIEKITEKSLIFNSRSGKLMVEKGSDGKIYLDFPSASLIDADEAGFFSTAGFPVPLEILRAKDDYLLLFDSQNTVQNLKPNFSILANLNARGVIATSPGIEHDFVCRFFGPAVGINEDPVTGSAFTKLIPYWSSKLNKSEMFAKQISQRGGEVWCELKEDRVLIGGFGNLYLEGKIFI